ncbi:MAG: 30S ribosomal protein S8, partial [Patescibacteria group bacterium]
RVYAGYKDFKRVRSGYGLLVVSTSKGIMSGAEARKQKIGGQVLFEVW